MSRMNFPNAHRTPWSTNITNDSTSYRSPEEAYRIRRPSAHVPRQRIGYRSTPSEEFGPPTFDIPESHAKPNIVQDMSMCDVDYDGDKEIVSASKPVRLQRPRHDRSRMRNTSTRKNQLVNTGLDPDREPTPELWKYLIRDNPLNTNCSSPLPGINEIPIAESPSPNDLRYTAPTWMTTSPFGDNSRDNFERRVEERAISTSPGLHSVLQDVARICAQTIEPQTTSQKPDLTALRLPLDAARDHATTSSDNTSRLWQHSSESIMIRPPTSEASRTRPTTSDTFKARPSLWVAATQDNRVKPLTSESTTSKPLTSGSIVVKDPTSGTAISMSPTSGQGEKRRKKKKKKKAKKSKKQQKPSLPQYSPQPLGFLDARFICKSPLTVQRQEKELNKSKAFFPDMPFMPPFINPIGSAASTLPPIAPDPAMEDTKWYYKPKPPRAASSGNAKSGNVRRRRYKLPTPNKQLG